MRSGSSTPTGSAPDDRYLLGTIADDDATTFPLESRPSLIRLYMACALADADILVESGVSEPVLAVLAEFTGLKPTTPADASKRTPRRLMVTDYPKTHPREGATAYRKEIDSIKATTDEHVRCQQWKRLRDAAEQPVLEMLNQDRSREALVAELLELAGQPRRDTERARLVDRQLHDRGWTDTDIRHHLSLHGFENHSRTLGVWNQVNIMGLRSMPQQASQPSSQHEKA